MDAVSSPVQPSAPPSEPCPRCQKPLTDPRGLGWCQNCGFCRSLEEDRAKLPLKKVVEEESQSVVVPRGLEAPKSNWYLHVSLLGVIVLVVACFFAARHFQLTPLHRAVWTTIQVFAGIAIMFAGQCYALIVIAPEEAALHFFDAIVPFRLYSFVSKRLPRACLSVILGTWGLTLVLSALIFVGGLSHWLNYLPKSKESQEMQWR